MMDTVVEQKKISDTEAETRLKELIKSLKEKGSKNINMVDIITTLHLPVRQVERIMKKLEKEKMVVENA